MPRKKTRAERKKQGERLDPLTVQSLRLPIETWEKLSWLALDQGITRADVIRRVLHDAVKNARPPKDRESRRIRATPEQWDAWRDAADHFEMPLDELIIATMERTVVGPLFGSRTIEPSAKTAADSDRNSSSPPASRAEVA